MTCALKSSKKFHNRLSFRKLETFHGELSIWKLENFINVWLIFSKLENIYYDRLGFEKLKNILHDRLSYRKYLSFSIDLSNVWKFTWLAEHLEVRKFYQWPFFVHDWLRFWKIEPIFMTRALESSNNIFFHSWLGLRMLWTSGDQLNK